MSTLKIENLHVSIDDKEILKSAISVDAGALEFASDRLKADKEIALLAGKGAGWTACYFSPELKADKEVMMSAAQNDGQVLYFASEELRDDKEVVLKAVNAKPLIVKYASLRLRLDKDVALAAIGKAKKKVTDFFPPEVLEYDEIKEILAEE